MEQFFGPHGDSVLHATIPFGLGLELGASPDLLSFDECLVSVLMCIGLTDAGLALARQSGSASLVSKLGQDFVLTDLYRPSRV